MDKPLYIRILKAGILTSIQDLGHAGLMDKGVPMGGAMDKSSARLVNEVLGNPADTPVLEITLLGPKLEFDQACWVAISGADLSPRLDGQEVGMNQPVLVAKNQILNFGKCMNGCRAYVGVAGTWLSKARKHGLPIPPLKAGDQLEILAHQDQPSPNSPTPSSEFPTFLEIPLLPGPEFEQFDKAFIAGFFSQKWTISPQSNRMGYRLMGQQLPDSGIKEILSSGIVPGTIQISGSGEPVILMADAQTTGGYPRIGLVASSHLDQLGQLKPGDGMKFVFTQHS